ncbi:MAG: inner membrane CreD family protein, partial [Bacteroidota bacterium]
MLTDPKGEEQERMQFKFNVNLNGSNSLSFGPIGKETIVELASSWSSPSFNGAFLPDERIVNEDGFNAKWKVLDLNRNYPQAWLDGKQNLLQSTFGVKLVQPVNEYAKNTRSSKYALLVISLTFLMFFFFEMINKQKVHPMHYILVGLAISVFYILLLSLSEHLGFNRAYMISSWATIGLIGAY